MLDSKYRRKHRPEAVQSISIPLARSIQSSCHCCEHFCGNTNTASGGQFQDGALSETHLRMLVEQIYVHDDNGKLSLDIHIKAPFQSHMDHYEDGLDGELLSTIIYGDVETKEVI